MCKRNANTNAAQNKNERKIFYRIFICTCVMSNVMNAKIEKKEKAIKKTVFWETIFYSEFFLLRLHFCILFSLIFLLVSTQFRTLQTHISTMTSHKISVKRKEIIDEMMSENTWWIWARSLLRRQNHLFTFFCMFVLFCAVSKSCVLSSKVDQLELVQHNSFDVGPFFFSCIFISQETERNFCELSTRLCVCDWVCVGAYNLLSVIFFLPFRNNRNKSLKVTWIHAQSQNETPEHKCVQSMEQLYER